MAVWADIGDDDEPEPEPSHFVHSQLITRSAQRGRGNQRNDNVDQRDGSEDVSIKYIAHALRCYPIAERLASYLDLTDLDALSTTCRSIRESLIQFAYQLKQHSLRCTFEVDNAAAPEKEDLDHTLALQLSIDDQIMLGGGAGPAFPVSTYSQPQPFFQSSLGLSGKISRCARDLVGPCRKCGTVVCRNCTEKPPSNKFLGGRLRRLCDSCLEAPLILHKANVQEASDLSAQMSSASSTRSARSNSSSSDETESEQYDTIEALSTLPDMWLRGPCTCASQGVFLCHQCGHNVRGADDIYQRVWRWRSRYSTHLGGGLGTGLGLGNQGQKCGRDKFCLATRDAMSLMETECSSEDVSTPGLHELSRSNTPILHDSEGDARPEPGYFRQEIEGIGGKVKSKSKKLVKVGATVYEFRDERESGKHLSREVNGELRSWCSWCSRVCPAKNEKSIKDDESRC